MPEPFLFVCRRGSRKAAPCAYCNREHARLCDYPVAGGTCSRKLCRSCTTPTAGGGDLCREHAPFWAALVKGERSTT